MPVITPGRSIKILLTLGCLFAFTRTGQPSDPVGDFVKAYMRDHQIPGCAIMVRDNGNVITKAYGKANLEHDVDVTPQTLFQSGSVGKQFTAMAVMLLVEGRQLSLDDPVSKYLDVPKSWSGIKVRHLLTHTSGLSDYPKWITYQENYDENGLLNIIKKQPLSFKPGEGFKYSNLGYATLGILIHAVSGEFYGDLLQRRVFDPLAMKHTRIINEDDIIPNRAAGYVLDNNCALKNQGWVSPTFNTTADGTLYFTVEDLAKWDEALDTEKLVSHASLEQMWTPFKPKNNCDSRYGFGWFICNLDSEHRLLWHDGKWQGFSAYIARYPEYRLTVAMLCNLYDVETGYVAEHIAGMYNRALASPALAKTQPSNSDTDKTSRRSDSRRR
jgi:CubicO group peptidase (beta-lactamase class C family)